ncbi:unnamed protein product [Protopolystoma xenopodis]|uniref:Dynein heavy chain region D6 P-loop domain-containing protein n=1 Tax=Protopolystoma xenopodis TaxID=117903 RepID=A0A3S4ZU38_9PLAT|nr:unnamed protein product [Protopolystoma xenopodis]
MLSVGPIASGEPPETFRYRQVAMGQGQLDLALREIREAVEVGDWVCLKNLHLVTSWLPKLEKEVNSLLLVNADRAGDETDAESDLNFASTSGTSFKRDEVRPSQGAKQPSVHPYFRLWLTAEPHINFPVALTQSCLKLAYEANAYP